MLRHPTGTFLSMLQFRAEVYTLSEKVDWCRTLLEMLRHSAGTFLSVLQLRAEVYTLSKKVDVYTIYITPLEMLLH